MAERETAQEGAKLCHKPLLDEFEHYWSYWNPQLTREQIDRQDALIDLLMRECEGEWSLAGRRANDRRKLR
jgi:hypothetical protein